MSTANLHILSALKQFLSQVSSEEQLFSQFRNSERAFTRKRKLCFKNLSLLIIRLCKKTLSVEIEDFFADLNSSLKCSVSAFSLQRSKLHPSFFYSWNKVLWMNFYDHYGNKVKRWRGYLILGCDGSSISLVNKPELQKYFGGQSNQTNFYTVAKTFYCYDVLNKIILFPKIAPYRYSELRMAYDLITSAVIKKDMLLIFDRYYSNYKMAALLQWQEKEIKYIIRVKDSLNFSKDFIASKKKSMTVELYPSPASIEGLKECGYKVTRDTPVKVRLIKVVLPSGKIEVLMTNLWEEEGIETTDFKRLYAMRWGVETNINFQKNILQLEALSGLTTISVMQDFYATILVSNLHFLLVKEAQQTIDDTISNTKYPLQINNNKAFGKIKENLTALFVFKDSESILKSLHDYFIRSPLPIRKGRTFPRVRKNPLSKSKFKTFTNFKPAF